MGSFSLSGGVEVLGFISPTDSLDTYAVIDPLYGVDGFRNVNFISDLDLIPEPRRRAGMVVGVSGGTTYYKLNSSPWNYNFTDWSVFNTGGGSVSGDYLPLSGGTVTGNTVFNLGLSANTISATTYQNLPIDIRVTGGTYSNGSVTFTNNTGGTFNVTGLYTGQTSYVNSLTTGVGLSGNSTNGNITIINTEPDQVVSISGGTNVGITGTYPNFNITLTGLSDNNIYTTGFTYSANTFNISDNSGNTFSTTIDTVTGLTVNGVLSAITYQNLPQYYAGTISGSTNWIDNNDGSITLPNLSVALFSTSDFSGPLNLYDISTTTFVLNNNDTNYIGIDYNGGSPIYFLSNNDGLINDSDVILYLIIYRANNFLHVLEFGDYGSGLPNKLNDRVLMTDRFAHETGCILGLSGATGIVTLTDGIVWNGVYRQIMSAITSNDGIFFQNYHIGGNWVYTTTASTLNNKFYDNGTNLVSATTGNYLVNWYFRGQEVNDHLYEVFGNNEYPSVSAAELSLEPLLPELVTSHAFLVGRIIVGVDQTTGLTQTAFVTPFVSSQVTYHNDLLGLQGGGPGEYYHLTSNEYNNLVLTNIDNNFSVGQTINGILSATTISSPGSTTQVIYNNGGVLSADTGFVYSGGSVGIGTTAPTARLSISGNTLVSGNISGGTFYGDGSNLTGLNIYNLTGGTEGQILSKDSSADYDYTWKYDNEVIQLQIISEGNTISDGFKGYRYVDKDLVLHKTTILANSAATVDFRVSYSGGTIGLVGITGQTTSIDTTLSGWVTNLSGGTFLEFNVDNAGSINTTQGTIILIIEGYKKI